MPRFALALLLVPACFFDADYGRAHVRCSDGVCPSGLTCLADKTCGTQDAGTGSDATVMHALTCNDPGTVMATNNGSTMGHTNQVAAMCGGVIYNGPDAIYQIAGSQQVTLKISGDYAVAAYVVSSCPSTTCETNMAAQPSAPLTITLPAGPQLVVVDGVNAGLSGTFTLTIQ
jgi:hypothetical protein